MDRAHQYRYRLVVDESPPTFDTFGNLLIGHKTGAIDLFSAGGVRVAVCADWREVLAEIRRWPRGTRFRVRQWVAFAYGMSQSVSGEWWVWQRPGGQFSSQPIGAGKGDS